MSHNSSDWAAAHTTYNVHDFVAEDCPPSLLTKTAEWRRTQEDMPHGHLIQDNSFFRSHKQGKVYMIHGTSNFDAIMSSGALYASAGCLVGSVYCAQVFLEGDRFRMHNLGDYILHEEVPSILAAHNKLKRDSKLLLFELDLPPNSNPLRAGVDYLRMGNIHYGLYRSLQYLLTDDEQSSIEGNITDMVHKSLDFLAYSNHLFLTNSHLSLSEARKFLGKMNTAATDLSMMGYLYFEAVSEYLMLNSTDKMTLALAEKKEFNNWLYKRMMYGIYEDLKGNFGIHCFNPTAEQLLAYVREQKTAGTLDLDGEAMLTYVAERVLYWINTRFFNNPGTSLNWLNGAMRFDSMTELVAPLIGHSIHRQLRAQDRYIQFYFYFDHLKALEVWNYWNKAGIALPFNGVFPKGEIGINPAFTNMKYKIYRATSCADDSQYVRIAEELPLEIVPRLVDLGKSFMRAGGHYSLNNQRGKEYART